MGKRVLLIIPAFNEEASLPKVQKELANYYKEKLPFTLDYIVIDDGSTDQTKQVCEEKGIPVISLPFNLGIGGAVQTGYLYAEKEGYDIAVQFDGDGQHDISYLPQLLDPVINGSSHLCIGSRFIEKNGRFRSSFTRRIGIRMLAVILRFFAKVKVSDPTSGFRAADKNAIKFLSRNYPVDYPEPESIAALAKAGYTISEVPVQMRERSAGKSSINVLQSIYYMIKVSLAIFCICLQRKENAYADDSKN